MKSSFDFLKTPINPGLTVIEASAGTGKTYQISHLVPRLLLDRTVANIEEILVVTYTNDAAAELASRIRSVMEMLAAPPSANENTDSPGLHAIRQNFDSTLIEEVISKALRRMDCLTVSTIHSFCMRVLQTEGVLCGYPVVPELQPDAREETEEALRGLWENEIANDPECAAVALAGGWKIDRQAAFFHQAIPLANPSFLPKPIGFDKLLEKLRSAAAAFDSKKIQTLAQRLKTCDTWNKDALSAEDRNALFQRLAAFDGKISVQFFQDVESFLNIPRTIAKRKKESKALADEISGHELYKAGKEIKSLLGCSEWEFQITHLPRLKNHVAETLRKAGRITYDGIVETVHRALKPEGKITSAALALRKALRERYHVALIDEAQDTDQRQFEIFSAIFLEATPQLPMVLIGDPKQAIYAFRGADVNTYLAARDLAAGNVYSLNKTFRASQCLVSCVNALFKRDESFLKAGLDFEEAVSGKDGEKWLLENKGTAYEASPPMEFWIVPDAGARHADFDVKESRVKRIAETVASEIVRLLNTGAAFGEGTASGDIQTVRPRDFAVLVSTHDQAQAVQSALEALGVPAVRSGGDDVMASEDAAELLTLLRAVQNPHRSGLLLAALATQLLGWDANAIAQLREAGNDGALERFAVWREETWQKQGIAALLARIEREEKIIQRLASHENGERRITNFRQLVEILQQAEADLGGNPDELIRWFASQIANAGARADSLERQLRLESDEEAVKILTMHTAKGLEFPFVFCPFLWVAPPKFDDVRINLLTRAKQSPYLVALRLLDEPSKASIGLELRRIAIEERLRLSYVAITRAQIKTWIVAGENSGSGKAQTEASALDWILRESTPADFAQWLEDAAKPGRAARHKAGLAAIKAQSRGTNIAFRDIPDPKAVPFKGYRNAPGTSFNAAPVPEISKPWSLTSFSGLTREKNPHGPPSIEEAPFLGGNSASTTPQPDAHGNLFLEAPGGSIVGTAIHDWIEQWDFTVIDRTALQAHLQKYRLPEQPAPPAFSTRVENMLEALKTALLPGFDCTIAQACSRADASEWQFHLRLRPGFGAHALAAIFERHGNRTYAHILKGLPVEALEGYLHGFIDRIAEFEGAYGVIDWKTNLLGTEPGAYETAQLLNCAYESHYFLQTHLYLVALRRYLPPGTPIAGAWLVFLRGIRRETSDGILYIAPTPALLDDLDKLFAIPANSLQ